MTRVMANLGLDAKTILRSGRAGGAVREALVGSLARGDAGPVGDVALLTEAAVRPSLHDSIQQEQKVPQEA